MGKVGKRCNILGKIGKIWNILGKVEMRWNVLSKVLECFWTGLFINIFYRLTS